MSLVDLTLRRGRSLRSKQNPEHSLDSVGLGRNRDSSGSDHSPVERIDVLPFNRILEIPGKVETVSLRVLTPTGFVGAGEVGLHFGSG